MSIAPNAITRRYADLWNWIHAATGYRDDLFRAAYRRDPVGRIKESEGVKIYIVTTPCHVVAKLRGVADEDLRARPLFDAASSSNWAEKLARLAIREFELKAADVATIKRVAAIQEPIAEAFYRRFGPKTVLSFTVAVLAFLASQVPKEIFEELDAVTLYAILRAALLGVFVLAAGVPLVIWWAAVRPRADRRARDTRLFNAVVVYLELLLEDQDRLDETASA